MFKTNKNYLNRWIIFKKFKLEIFVELKKQDEKICIFNISKTIIRKY